MNDLLWVMTVIQKSTYAYKKACDLELCDQEVIFQCTHISFWRPSLLDPMYHFVYQYYGTKVSRQAFYSMGRSTFWLGQKLKDLTTKLGWLHRDYVQIKENWSVSPCPVMSSLRFYDHSISSQCAWLQNSATKFVETARLFNGWRASVLQREKNSMNAWWWWLPTI